VCVGVNKRFMGTPTRRVSEPGLGDDPGNQVYYRVIGPIYIYIYIYIYILSNSYSRDHFF